ncbi:MAG: helix-turn-helix domain-containing protein [Clostridia bacterium]|nr:helix-turn-helix domain-containing protein [Clostridia bacterium]
MISDPVLKEYFEPFCKEEFVYKRYHTLLQQPETFEKEFKKLKKDIENNGDKTEHYWLPEVNSKQKNTVDRMLWYPFHADIGVAKHMRYHPRFRHKHDFYEIIYVLDGSCTNYISEPCVLRRGNICVIPPNVPHSIGVFDESIIANILIRKESINTLLPDFLGFPSGIPAFFAKTLSGALDNEYIVFSGESEKISFVLNNLIKEEIKKDDYSPVVKKMLLTEALVYLEREKENISIRSAQTIPDEKIIRKVRIYLNEHIREATLKSTAEHFNYSVPYLSRLIHRTSGQTFTVILKELRVSKACEILDSTDKPVSDISDMLGYDSPVSFTRMFKSALGLSPSEYRRDNRITMMHLITRV